MSKASVQPDVLVLGEHPTAYLAAVLLRDKPSLGVVHSTIPGERVPDRLSIVNPQLFSLHSSLNKLKKKLELTAMWGVNFVADDADTAGEYRAKASAIFIGCYSDVRKHLSELAKEVGVRLMKPKNLEIRGVDENGLEVAIDDVVIRPKALLLAGEVSAEMTRTLGLPEPWPTDILKRYCFVRIRGEWNELGSRPTMPMSLDLSGELTWAWMLPGKGELQLAVEQKLDAPHLIAPAEHLNKWAEVLRRHGLIKANGAIAPEDVEILEVAAAGALNRECVANRTLLFGPAGGFFTACMEDIYPNCWSAVFAVESIRKALKETHLQDALDPHRHRWATTLGDYLRGPQQNLRFLLPLIYRNPVMTSRLAESILLGKSVVR